MLDLGQIINDAIQSALDDVFTALPGEIVSYDPQKRLAQIQPSFRLTMSDGSTLTFPIINEVPVQFPGSSTASLTYPLQRGDGGLILFSTLSLEEWIAGSSSTFTGDPRKFSVNDAIFIPGLFQPNRVPEPSSTDGLQLKYQNGMVKIKTDALLVEFDDLKIEMGGGKIVSSGTWEHDGDFSLTGDVNADGDVFADAAASNVTLKNHGHAAAFGPTISKIPAGEA
jgi:hypothetical protein